MPTATPAHQFSVFEIAGPIMVGPSSSHTAGACKIGQIARALFHATPFKVTFVLHGSFATVYKGHATDRAILGGVMKMKTADPNIKQSFDLAKEKGLQFEFKTADLGPEYHPNTVKVILEADKVKPMEVIGSSLGGGMVKIVKIDQFPVEFRGAAGQYKTLIVWHANNHPSLKDLKEKLTKWRLKIHDMQTARVGSKALSIINIDGRDLKLREVLRLEKIPGIEYVRSLTKLIKD